MKKILLIVPFLLTGVLLVAVMADDDEDHRSIGRSIGDVAVSKDATYIKECGSCHFAYQPGLLPKRSWVKMMNTLDNHFKDDASLDQKTTKYITNYLVKNSSDNAMDYKRSRKITNSISVNQTPHRITKTPYFIHKHDEIPKKIIVQKEVGTLGNCIACHTAADRGIYSERAIKIPNYGRWDDD